MTKKIMKEDTAKEYQKLQNKKPINFNKKNKKNTEKLKTMGNITRKKRMKWELFIACFLLLCLTVRIGVIQFAQGEELQAMAYKQQTLDRNINPKRGTIYDATGKVVLAVSSTVQTISVTPTTIAKSDREKIAQALARIFELDYETILKKVSKRSSIETIAKKVEKEKADELRVWMKENQIESGIHIDEDTKRYYPLNNLASQVIGFCGSDNQGLDGIEAIYDEQLKGSKGKIIKMRDASRRRYRKYSRRICKCY